MYGIALDLGTSGFRAQLIDLETKETLKTVITMGHPLPGGNVMDHLDFAITTGEDVASWSNYRNHQENVPEIQCRSFEGGKACSLWKPYPAFSFSEYRNKGPGIRRGKQTENARSPECKKRCPCISSLRTFRGYGPA